jgi:hypothetical protein
MINHKKRERKARERSHQPEEVVAELRSKSVCPTRKLWGKRQGYKYPTIHYPFEVDDTQEIQERERCLLRCHPCDHFSLTSGTHLTVPHKQL